VVEEYALIMGEYHVGTVWSDQFAFDWVKKDFEPRGFYVAPCKLSKTELYINFSYLLSEGLVWLPYSERGYQQLMSLERRVTRGGAESVDHPAYGGAHDDLANVLAGGCVMLGQEGEPWNEIKKKSREPILVKTKAEDYKRPEGKKVEQMRECAEEMEKWFREEPGTCPLVKNRWRF
jgi:hypothetical protein